jgi:transposase-like protein
MRKLLKKQRVTPTVIVADKLRSYAAAFAELGLAANHERGLRQNNRAEVSHQPIRRRERKILGSSQQDQLSTSSLCMPPSTTRSMFNAI